MPSLRDKSTVSKALEPSEKQNAIHMTRFKALAVETKYWKPGTDSVEETVHALKGKAADGDFVAVSEKAISTASNNIIDEKNIQPTLNAELIARFWMRTTWGFILGPLCRLRQKLLSELRGYPLDIGSRHKQLALQYSGLLQALMFGSEGGIDGSNLPYSYVCLPLKNADEIAKKMRRRILEILGKSVVVVVVDTDKTYSFRNFHFTPRPNPVRGIHSGGGFLAYVIGRFLQLKKRATPLAVAGSSLSTEEALHVAELANRARGFGAGRTVWEMAEHFNVKLESVSWEMLETVRHKPIVIVRKKR